MAPTITFLYVYQIQNKYTIWGVQYSLSMKFKIPTYWKQSYLSFSEAELNLHSAEKSFVIAKLFWNPISMLLQRFKKILIYTFLIKNFTDYTLFWKNRSQIRFCCVSVVVHYLYGCDFGRGN